MFDSPFPYRSHGHDDDFLGRFGGGGAIAGGGRSSVPREETSEKVLRELLRWIEGNDSISERLVMIIVFLFFLPSLNSDSG